MRFVMTLGLLSLLAIAMAPPAVAGPGAAAFVQADNPYRVVVPVADTSADNRNQAFGTALAQVMQRVSGHVPAAAVLATAATYVQQYQYQQAPAGAAQPFRLVVMFAPAAIEHLEKTLAEPAPAATTPAGGAGAIVSAPAGANDNLVWVTGIHSALDFADAVAALDNAPGVDSVGVRSAQGDGMLVDVHTTVPLARILAGLALAGHLTASAQAHAGAAASLRWRR